MLISSASEEKMGVDINNQLLTKYTVTHNKKFDERINRVGDKLVSSIKDKRGITYKFGVVQDENLNAFTIPGGYIYATTGLMEAFQSDDQLAAVLAHEIGHSEARHAVKKLEAAIGYTTFMTVAYVLDTREEDKKGEWKYLKTGTDVAFSLINLGYGRKDEYEADKLSVKYTYEAGYDPYAIIAVMEKLKEKEAGGNAKWLYFLRSHPYLDERMDAAVAEMSKLPVDIKKLAG
jgi:predicted Zn-dependent protease